MQQFSESSGGTGIRNYRHVPTRNASRLLFYRQETGEAELYALGFCRSGSLHKIDKEPGVSELLDSFNFQTSVFVSDDVCNVDRLMGYVPQSAGPFAL